MAYYDRDKSSASNYAETHPGRLRQFKKILSNFGDIDFQEKSQSSTKMKTLVFPRIWTDILVTWGLHQGDKTVLNIGIPDFIKYGSDAVKLAYLEEMICEDGSVETKNGTFKMKIIKASILRAGSRSSRYGVPSKIAKKHVELIKKRGTRNEMMQSKQVSWKKLKELMKSDNPKEASTAEELVFTALSNTCRMLDDELDILSHFGIMMKPQLTSINYYERTGRVSASWAAGTASVDDAVKWGLIAPPNDVRKRNQVKKSLEMREKKVAEFKHTLNPHWLPSDDEVSA